MFPPEILCLVFDSVPKSDLKSIRLVSSTWCDLATPSLFDRIYLSHRRKDVEVFEAWTQNERCRKAVKEVVFDTTFLDSYMTLREYTRYLWSNTLASFEIGNGHDFEGSDFQVQQLFHHWWCGKLLQPGQAVFRAEDGSDEAPDETRLQPEETLPSQFLDYPLIKGGYEEYLVEARWEMEMRKSGESFIRLARGMECFPRLRRVTLQEDGFTCRKFLDTRTLEPVHLAGTPFLRSWHPLYLPPFDRAATHDVRYEVRPTLISFSRAAFLQDWQGVICAIAESSSIATDVAFLVGEPPFKYVDGVPVDKAFDGSPGFTERCKVAFTKAKSFAMRIDSDDNIDDYHGTHYEQSHFHGLHAALSACINLQYLNLEPTRSRLPLSRVLPCTLTFSELRDLKLSWFVMGEDEIARFLSHLTLQSLWMENSVIRIRENIEAKVRVFCNTVVAIPKVKLQISVWPSGTQEETGDRDFDEMAVRVGLLDTVPIVTKEKYIDNHWSVDLGILPYVMNRSR